MKILINFLAAIIFLSSSCYAATIVVPTGQDPIANGNNFTQALHDAHPGDTIILQAGATYTPTDTWGFWLPYKEPATGTDADYITITTSKPEGIPAEGVRVDPAIHAAAMPRIMGKQMAVSTYNSPKSHHWKFVGIEFTNDGTVDTPGLIILGAFMPYEDHVLMRGFTIDRCFIHPAEISADNLSTPFYTSMAKAVGSGLPDTRLINSYVVGGGVFDKYGGQIGAGMAFLADSGTGPILVENNYLEAFYSPIFLGGADATPIPDHMANISPGATMNQATLSNTKDIDKGDLVVFQIRPQNYTNPRYKTWGVGKVTSVSGNTVNFDPLYSAHTELQGFDLPPMAYGQAQWEGTIIHDVTIRRNTIVAAHPGLTYVWTEQKRFPKAYIEVKAAVNLTLDSNIWQSSIPTNLAFYPQNQNGGFPWVEVSNVKVINNKIIGAARPFILALNAAYNVQQEASHNYIIRNNLVDAFQLPGMEATDFIELYTGRNILVTHNTVLQTGSPIHAGVYLEDRNISIIDNIFRNGWYGLTCETYNWTECFGKMRIEKNIITDNRQPQDKGYPLLYKDANFIVDNETEIGWADPENSNYTLLPSSPYKGKATDEKDPGVDMEELEAALAGLNYTTKTQPPIPGDVNQDRIVNIKDIQEIIKDFGKTANYNELADQNNDHKIDLLDVMIVVKNWGRTQ